MSRPLLTFLLGLVVGAFMTFLLTRGKPSSTAESQTPTNVAPESLLSRSNDARILSAPPKGLKHLSDKGVALLRGQPPVQVTIAFLPGDPITDTRARDLSDIFR